MSPEDQYESRKAKEKASRQRTRDALVPLAEARTVDDVIHAFRGLAKLGIEMLDEDGTR